MNVQQLIIKGIKEQLFFNNYLVVPGFGGFVLKSSSSHFSGGGAILMPPSKTLGFNAQLKQNDGILATWLQTKLKCTSSEALSNLNEFADYCKSILTTRRRLSIEGVGFFYLDFENNICFEPQLDTNFLLDSFGLQPLTLLQITDTVTEVRKEIVTEDRIGNEAINVITTEIKKQRNYRRVIAPLALLVAVFSLLSLLVTNTKISGPLKAALYGSNEAATYSPLTYPALNLTQTKSTQPEYVTDANGIATVEADTKLIAVKVFETEASSTKINTIAHSTSDKFFKHSNSNFEVVLGCFSVLDNAKRMLKKLKRQNINAVIAEQNNKGMYVVSNGDFATKEQAISQLERIDAVCPNAWVKKPGQ